MQAHELYKPHQYATAVYRSELATRLKVLGYEIDSGKSGQPEIKGYSEEYLAVSSPRRQQIEEHLAKENQRGADAPQIAAHKKRKEEFSLVHAEVKKPHREIAETCGNQPSDGVRDAKETICEIAQ